MIYVCLILGFLWIINITKSYEKINDYLFLVRLRNDFLRCSNFSLIDRRNRRVSLIFDLTRRKRCFKRFNSSFNCRRSSRIRKISIGKMVTTLDRHIVLNCCCFRVVKSFKQIGHCAACLNDFRMQDLPNKWPHSVETSRCFLSFLQIDEQIEQTKSSLSEIVSVSVRRFSSIFDEKERFFFIFISFGRIRKSKVRKKSESKRFSIDMVTKINKTSKSFLIAISISTGDALSFDSMMVPSFKWKTKSEQEKQKLLKNKNERIYLFSSFSTTPVLQFVFVLLFGRFGLLKTLFGFTD